jgi:hypothetical protein
MLESSSSYSFIFTHHNFFQVQKQLHTDKESTLKKTEGTIKNGQSKETGIIGGYTRQRKTKQEKKLAS